MDNVIGRGQHWDLIQDCWAQWPGQEIFQNSELEDCNRLTVENENSTSVTSWKSCVNSTNNIVNQTKGCLSLFNYFIDMSPTLMSPFFVEKTCFFLSFLAQTEHKHTSPPEM